MYNNLFNTYYTVDFKCYQLSLLDTGAPRLRYCIKDSGLFVQFQIYNHKLKIKWLNYIVLWGQRWVRFFMNVQTRDIEIRLKSVIKNR